MCYFPWGSCPNIVLVLAFFVLIIGVRASIFSSCFGEHIHFSAHDWFECAVRAVPADEAIKFVQIGANDGILLDPLHAAMSRTRQWRGVFVEPVPQYMAELRKNKEPLVPGCGYVEAAINATCPPGGRVTFFMPIVNKNSPNWLSAIGSLTVPPGRQEVGTFKRIHVACHTPTELSSTVRAHKAEWPHIMLVDAEGYDIAILMAFASWPFGKPSIIAFEIWDAENKPHAIADVIKFLNKSGYLVVQAQRGEDWIAILTTN